MRKSVGMLLLAFWAFSLCRVPVAVAVEAVPLPPQVPAHTASGATNLTDVWLHSGGGRLYWNTLVTPRQIALEGARFVDPAAVPELSMTPQADKKPPVRQAKRKVKVSKAAPQSATSPAPKGVGKTSLPAPVSSAIPAMNNAASAQAPSGASATGPAKSANAAPAPSSAPMPYSSAAASSVGSIGGAGGGAMPDVPAPSAFSADDVLPRANARP
ncbi:MULTISPECIES: hypothetical protein [Desulfovibrio]|uniref:Uncharacterized protein n=1 Tax=uncultured Desulfovibrio sp. TaxID=167968 RepID=A0A212JHR6_9BACT|nr:MULTISPECIES: hypothetical protein [Desulfovibrio]MBT9749561.1 hypothetical protein [Desulfovibrio desulfuricans]MCB6541648.1 hypothetical protein [Desulfovibrio desulfuricans]MCB6552729.1 hypothetical protein [Desulfovibrio desulfuricans]MCB6564648.1 hypothetical protein [Desulfovibrio desulfuricans]MCB7345754.1 hypothetical protein [Desulfovibrio desulfuricans]